MIRERKSSKVPASLSRTRQYNGEDVVSQLLEDQHEKCYICERKVGTDYQVEHFKSQKNNLDLVQDWNNLLLACSYCNGKKSDSFDDNLNPLANNVEEEISQRIDFAQNKALFESYVSDKEHTNTIEMLELFYNGKGNRKLRSIKEERFFNHAKQKVIDFLRMVNEYMIEPTEQNRNIVSEELSIDKELLGFKYWIIYDNHLNVEFENNIIWNK